MKNLAKYLFFICLSAPLAVVAQRRKPLPVIRPLKFAPRQPIEAQNGNGTKPDNITVAAVIEAAVRDSQAASRVPEIKQALFLNIPRMLALQKQRGAKVPEQPEARK